nr:MAG TPA: hypothetical protein [Caudoviricetes sp.]
MVKRFIFAYKPPFYPFGYTYRRNPRNRFFPAKPLCFALSATIVTTYSRL